MSAASRSREIVAALRERIDKGALLVGDWLPTEQALVDQYDAPHAAVRQALRELREIGLVEIRPGIGTFVPAPRVVRRLDGGQRLSRQRRQRNAGAFLAEAEEQGFEPLSSVRVWFEPAQDLGEMFGIAEDAELCVRDRIMLADDRTVLLAVSRLPRNITRDSAVEALDTGPGGMFARLEELGFEPSDHEETVRARMPDANERQILDFAGPVLCVRRRTRSHGSLIEINDMVMPASTYELRYSWPAE